MSYQVIKSQARFRNGFNIDVAVPYESLMSLFVEFYEKNEVPATFFFYDAADRVLDCGAGIGYITSLISKKAGLVVAVEALPEMIEIIRINTILNECQNVVIKHGALTHDGRESIEFNRRTLVYASSSTDSHDEVQEVLNVAGLPIDPLIRQYELNALHLDLEGMECALLMDMNLEPINKIFFETHPYAYVPDELSSMIAHLLDSGFESVFMGNPFGKAFPEQSCVFGFARSGPAAQAVRERFIPDNMYQTLKITLQDDRIELCYG